MKYDLTLGILFGILSLGLIDLWGLHVVNAKFKTKKDFSKK
jgi:hypothetical protein